MCCKMNNAYTAPPHPALPRGPSGQFPQTDAFDNTRNHYTDECLNKAAGGGNAGLDFYQMHCYAWGNDWSPNAPFAVSCFSLSLSE